MVAIDVFPPRPVPNPLMLQSWENLSFLHWRCDSRSLQKLLPRGVEVDVFDGSAWVGVTPFRVVNVRPPGMPSLPWISTFPETNVRTYVYGPDGERGIWFFSLEADRLLAVIAARTLYGLPYRWANMRAERLGDVVEYKSDRHDPRRPAHSTIRVRIGQRCRTAELESFLTSRFRLYTILHRKMAFADVEHEPWPLYSAHVIEIRQNLLEGSGLPPYHGEPIVHYSPGVHTRIAAPRQYRVGPRDATLRG